MLDLVLRGGMVLDGTGIPAFPASIGISGGRIVSIGGNPKARQEIDIRGLVATPGFIDTHGHSEFTLLADPSAQGKLLQGITTEINGNCGLSGGPLLGPALRQREPDMEEYGIKERWESLGQYLDLLETRGPALNYATLVGHGNIRASVMGYEDREPSDKEMARMEELLVEAVADGALGMSTGLIYPPGIYSKPGEIEALARSGLRARNGFVYASHMRSEGERLLESVEETLNVGRASGARVHISHIKASDRSNWHKAEKCIELLEGAQADGLEVSCDRYPYTASSTDLDAVLPAWMYEGGATDELERLKSAEARERIRAGRPLGRDIAGAIVVNSVASEEGRWMEGMSLLAISEKLGLDVVDALCEVLLKERLRVGAIFHVMSPENMKRFLALPYCMVGSDSSARAFDGPTARGKPHPRSFGSFPVFLSGWEGELAEAVRKITSLAAWTFGLDRRGAVKEGFWADLAVIDPQALGSGATYSDPFVAPSGVRHVIVNGVACVKDGKLTGERSGMVLRSD